MYPIFKRTVRWYRNDMSVPNPAIHTNDRNFTHIRLELHRKWYGRNARPSEVVVLGIYRDTGRYLDEAERAQALLLGHSADPEQSYRRFMHSEENQHPYVYLMNQMHRRGDRPFSASGDIVYWACDDTEE